MRRALGIMALVLGSSASQALTVSPRPTNTPAPQYPSWAIGSGISTEVELRVLIGRDGRVRTLEVIPYNVRKDILTRDLRASFDSAAVRAVRTWAFRPATQDGRAVSVWWTLRVPFSDPEDAAPGDSMAWIADTVASIPPEPIEQEAAEWSAATLYGCRGRVTVRIFPGPDGKVWGAHVARSALSCQDPSLRAAAEAAAVGAARRWRYRPGEHEGEPILVDFRVPAPRLDVPVIVGCVRDSLNGRLRQEAEIFGRAGHAFGTTDVHGWFVLRGGATREPKLRAAESSPCRAGGFRAIRPWKQPGDEITLYTAPARCQDGKR